MAWVPDNFSETGMRWVDDARATTQFSAGDSASRGLTPMLTMAFKRHGRENDAATQARAARELAGDQSLAGVNRVLQKYGVTPWGSEAEFNAYYAKQPGFNRGLTWKPDEVAQHHIDASRDAIKNPGVLQLGLTALGGAMMGQAAGAAPTATGSGMTAAEGAGIAEGMQTAAGVSAEAGAAGSLSGNVAASQLDKSLVVQGDPIATMINIQEATGAATWNEAAVTLGYGSADELLATAVLPATGGVAGAATTVGTEGAATAGADAATVAAAAPAVAGATAPAAATAPTGGAAASTASTATQSAGWETLRNQLALSSAISGVLSGLDQPSLGDEARLSRASERARRQVTAQNRREVAEAFKDFDDQYFDSIASAFENYYRPQVEEDFDTLEEQTIYAAPGGVGSSAFASRLGKVAEGRQKAMTAVGQEAFGEAERARGDVESQRASLLGLAESAEDPRAFGEQAVAAARSAARPQSYSPLADLMARYGGMLTDLGESQRRGYQAPRPLSFGSGSGGSSSGSSWRTVS